MNFTDLISPLSGIFSEIKKPISYSDLSNKLTNLLETDKWFIAGGYAVNPETANDIDIYFLNEADYKFAEFKVQAKRSELRLYYTANALNVKHNDISKSMQLINLNHGTPEEVLDAFDLTTCKVALLPNGKKVYGENYTSTINIDTDNFTSDTLYRTIKYIEKGYNLDPAFKSTLIELAEKGNNMTKKTYDNAKEYTYDKVLQDFIHSATLYKCNSNALTNAFKAFKKEYPEYYV